MFLLCAVCLQMMTTQLEWKLNNPRGTDAELLEHLNVVYAEFLE
jgi:hypothetical protein